MREKGESSFAFFPEETKESAHPPLNQDRQVSPDPASWIEHVGTTDKTEKK